MKKAFTLIELLVVLAIIALLMAVMLPSLAKAREQGKELYCQNNLRQMTIAAIAYTQSFDGYFPIAYYSRKTPEQKTQFCWDFTVRKYAGGTTAIEPGILWQGDGIDKIQQCPSYKGESNTAYDPYTGYNYNTSFVGHGQMEAIVLPVRAMHIRYPAGCALFGDGQTTIGANKYMRSPLASGSDDVNFSSRWAGTQGFRHNRRTNVAWADGSLASLADCFTDTTMPEDKASLDDYNRQNPDAQCGFLSPDNTAYDLK